jgi:hypothetical protein
MDRNEEDDYIHRHPLDDGNSVVIVLAEDGSRIDVRTADDKEIGHIELYELEDGSYFINWMYLDKAGPRFLRRGIGRAALKFHKEFFGCSLCAADNDGHRRDDGGHPTGDAPRFMAKMRREGIVGPSSLDQA